MALLPGSKAPDFTLNSVLDGKEEKVSILFINFIEITNISSPQVNLSQFFGQHVHVHDLSDMNCTLLAISTEHISSQMKSQITPRSAPRSPHTLTNILWFAGLRLGWTYLG